MPLGIASEEVFEAAMFWATVTRLSMACPGIVWSLRREECKTRERSSRREGWTTECRDSFGGA